MDIGLAFRVDVPDCNIVNKLDRGCDCGRIHDNNDGAYSTKGKFTSTAR